MSSLSPRQFVYLFVQSGIGAAIANAVINGGIAWAQTRSLPVFTVWTVPGVALDLMGTAFGVTFGTFLTTGLQVKWDVSRGKITAPTLDDRAAQRLAALTSRLPPGVLRPALRLGLVSVAFSVPVIAALGACGIHGLERAAFIELKATFAAMQGAVVTPVLVLVFLERTPGRAAPALT